jgi:hypothetical protein
MADHFSMAQLRIVTGDTHMVSGSVVDASNIYRENVDAVDEDQEGDLIDLAAISKLRLSRCKLAQGDLKGSQ